MVAIRGQYKRTAAFTGLALFISMLILLSVTNHTIVVGSDCGSFKSQSNTIIVSMDANRYTTTMEKVKPNVIYDTSYLEVSTEWSRNTNGTPKDVHIWAGSFENEIFNFTGRGYGGFGDQDAFANGNTTETFLCPFEGTQHTISFYLPSGAAIQSATMDVLSFEKVLNWSSPGYLNEDVGGSSIPILTLGQISAGFADIDDDGDIDMLVGGYSTVNETVFFYENIGSPDDPLFRSSDIIFDNVSFDIKANPRFADIDGDGDYDLFVGEYYGSILFFRNNGTKAHPIWNQETFLEGRTFGSEVCPAFADMDGDGRLDMVVGQHHPDSLIYLRNTGTLANPGWTEENIFRDVELGDVNMPSLLDYDFDGDNDLFVGHHMGPISFYENIGNSSHPKWSNRTSILERFDFDYYVTPVFSDLSGDGYDDLIVGSNKGYLYYLERSVSFPREVTIKFEEVEKSIDLGQIPRVTRNVNFTDDLIDMHRFLEPSMWDEFQSFCLFNLTLVNDRMGGLVLSGLSIKYDLSTSSHDFNKELNDYLTMVREGGQGPYQPLNYSLIFYSSTGGKLGYTWTSTYFQPLRIVGELGPFQTLEDCTATQLFDLHRVVEYRYGYSDLKIELHGQGENIANLYTVDNRFLLADNTRSPMYKNWTGTQEVWISVQSLDGFYVRSDTFTIETLPVNDEPSIMSRPLTLAYEDRLYSYRLLAHDADGDNLSSRLFTGPASMVMDDDWVVRWTPRQEDVGLHEVVLSVSDGETEVLQSFSLAVLNVNDAPFFTEVPDIIVERDSVEHVDWIDFVSDIDTPPPDLSVSTDSPFVDVRGFSLVILVPMEEEKHEIPVIIQVSDGELDATAELSVYVTHPPSSSFYMDPLPEIEVFRARQFLFDVSGYIHYDGERDSVGVYVYGDHVIVDQMILSIIVPETETRDSLRAIICASDHEMTFYSFLDISVLDDSQDKRLLLLPPIHVLEDEEYSLDLSQYMSNSTRDQLVMIQSESEHVRRTRGSSVDLFFSMPVSTDVLGMIVLENGGMVPLEIPVVVIPRNDPPLLVKPLENQTVKPGDVLEIVLSEHFTDEEGDLLVFEITGLSDPTIDEGVLKVTVNDGDGTVECTIVAREGEFPESMTESNPFTITFEEGPSSSEPKLLLSMILSVISIVIIVIALFRKKLL